MAWQTGSERLKPPKLVYLLCSPPLCIRFRTRSGVVIYPLFLVLYKLLIKLRIEIVEILFIQLVLYLFQRLPETLKMNDFPGPEKFKGFSYLRVFNNSDQVVIGGPGFLFCRQVLMEICYGIALGLEFTGIKGTPAAAVGHRAVVWSI